MKSVEGAKDAPARPLAPQAPPPPEQNVIAITETARCVGFRRENGRWYSTYSGQPLRCVLAWEPMD